MPWTLTCKHGEGKESRWGGGEESCDGNHRQYLVFPRLTTNVKTAKLVPVNG